MDEGGRRPVVKAWTHGGLLLESYRYAPGPVEAPPRHSHEEHQFGLCLHSHGEYRYRGARHPVPVGAVSAIQSGEAHRTRDVEERPLPATYLQAYAGPGLVARVAAEVSGGEGAEPSFADPVVRDRELAGLFLGLCSPGESALERDSLALSFLARLAALHGAGGRPPRRPGRESRAVGAAREYLEDNFAEDVSLEDLSRAANLSRFHLARSFKGETGLTPFAYLTGVRVDRAKGLLVRGSPVARAASEAGFYDQSHLARHFKRLVGVPPGRYAKTGGP